MQITLNGRYLSAAQTGVQRVANNLILGLDRSLARSGFGPDNSYQLRAPRDVHQAPSLSSIVFQNRSLLRGQAWEQLELPFAAERGGLVNLCNAAPLFFPSALTMIHDAQIYLTPMSYSSAFVAWYKFALPKISDSSRYILTVSEYSKQMICRFRVTSADKIIVIPNGADHILQAKPDTEILKRLHLRKFEYIFAFGNTQRHKHTKTLLDAFGSPRLRDMRLVICGSLDWALVWNSLGSAPNDKVLLTGQLSDSETRALMESAACLALPSETEGFGLPALEAMILGCPALVAPCGALPEVCGTAAIYAPLEDVEAWVDAMVKLVEDDGGRAERRRRSIAHASTYTWDHSASLFRAALEKAIG